MFITIYSSRKKNVGSKENTAIEKLKADYQQNLRNYKESLKRSLEEHEKIKRRKQGLKRAVNNELTLEMVNPRITGTNPDPWLEFDIMASSDVPTYFNRCAIIMSYDSSLTDAAFDDSVMLRGNIQISLGPLFDTATYDDPQTIVIDYNYHAFAIPFGVDWGATAINRVQLTSTPKKMLQIRIKIQFREKPAAIFFSDTGMTSNVSTWTYTANEDFSNMQDYIHPTQYIGTNNDKTCVPIIDSFTDNVPAGIGKILRIKGRYFGDSLDKDIKSVVFKNANRGDVYPSGGLIREGVDNYDIKSWNHNFIQIRLPSVIDSITPDDTKPDYHSIPGSGKFLVKNKFTHFGESNSVLTIPYAVQQFIDTNNYSKYTKTNQKLSKRNTKNGYTLHVSNVLDSMYPGAKAVIKKAMREWTCITGINWELGSNTSLRAIPGDGIFVIDVDPNITASQRTLIDVLQCNTNNPHQYSMHSFDILINSNAFWQFDTTMALMIGYLDFYACISHELGHGHFLEHVNDKAIDIMYWFPQTATMIAPVGFPSRKTITNSPDATAGGEYITNNLKGATNCLLGHTLVKCGGTKVKNLQFDKSTIVAYPNPISNGHLNIKTTQNFISETYFNVFDNMGRLVNRIDLSSIEGDEYKIPVDNLSSGIYLLQIVSGNTQQSIKFVKQ